MKTCRSCGETKDISEFAKAGFNLKTGKPQIKSICKCCHSFAVCVNEKQSRIKKGQDYADCSNEECGFMWCYRYKTNNRYKKRVTVIKRVCPKCGSLPENLEDLT